MFRLFSGIRVCGLNWKLLWCSGSISIGLFISCVFNVVRWVW